MALDKKLRDRLAKAGKQWSKAKQRAETEKGGFDEIEDGRYVARLVGAEVNESKSSSRIQVQWTYKIVEGDYKGRQKMDFDGLETEDNLMYLAKKLARYGYEVPDDLTDVEALLNEIVKAKPLVKIRLKTKGGSDFQNAYLDAVYDQEDEAEVLAEAAAESGDGDADEDAAEADEEAEAVEEEAPEEAELTVGMKVVASFKGEDLPGEVVEIIADEQKARVKTDSGKVIRVAIDKLALPDDDAAEEAEEEEESDDDVPAAPAKAPVKKKK
jgi:hypothetical protein